MDIVIADDSNIVRARLRDLIHEIPHAKVIGNAKNVEDTLDLVDRLGPDLVFLNFQILGESGLKALRTIKHSASSLVLVILTDNASAEYQTSCSSAGADYVFDIALDITKIQTLIRELIG